MVTKHPILNRTFVDIFEIEVLASSLELVKRTANQSKTKIPPPIQKIKIQPLDINGALLSIDISDAAEGFGRLYKNDVTDK